MLQYFFKRADFESSDKLAHAGGGDGGDDYL
jgi:hypothetical protein